MPTSTSALKNRALHSWRSWCLPWLWNYSRADVGSDVLAGVVVTLLIVPQSLAYALLAGLPPVLGLVASVLPVMVYSLFGRSSVLAVGPVAVTSLMTLGALTPLAVPGSLQYAQYALWLALLSGGVLLALGLLRLGFLSRVLSFPVLSGFTSAAALLIVLNQLPVLLGVHTLNQWRSLHWPSLVLSFISLLVLALARRFFKNSWVHIAPLLWLVLASAVVLSLPALGIAQVGALNVKTALPTIEMLSGTELKNLFPSAVMLALMSMVASLAAAKSLGRARGETLDANTELRALGLANLASGFSAAFPVAGGFSRSAVYAHSGARSPLAGLVSGMCMIFLLFWLMPWLALLPLPVLSAAIVLAAFALIDVRTLRHAWRYDRADATAWLTTAATVLLLDLQAGIVTGVLFSLGAFLWRASQPHIAVVGLVPGTQSFRNVQRYAAQTQPGVLMLRVDESLFFANIEPVRDTIHQYLHQQIQPVQRLVLLMSAVNAIDETALDGLSELARELKNAGVMLEFAELKGPVHDRLIRVPELAQIKVWLTAYQAFQNA
jgi:SulP family sulfate permease